FFSSRRRHTRWPRDWSSDVCSSDLISTSGAVVDRFVVGARFDALTFTHTDLGYGHDLFYYLRHDAGNGFSTFGTIATSGAIVDRFGVGFRFNAIATGSP